MKKSIGLILATVVAVALVAGCNSNNGNNNNGLGSNCGGPPNALQVLFPRPNASRVNPNVGGVYVATNPALAVGNSFDFFVVQSNGAQQHTSQFATYTGPIPTPHNSPAPGSTVYVTYFPQLVGPLQGVNLYWNNGASFCNPNVIVSSFSTSQ